MPESRMRGNEKPVKTDTTNSKNQQRPAWAQKEQQRMQDDGDTVNKNTRFCTFKANQTRTWKPLDEARKLQLCNLINEKVAYVCVKSVFYNDADVEATLQQAKHQLKTNLQTVRVPPAKKRRCRFTIKQLQDQKKALDIENRELEEHIGEEERMIKELEKVIEDEKTMNRLSLTPSSDFYIKVPCDQLHLPSMDSII